MVMVVVLLLFIEYTHCCCWCFFVRIFVERLLFSFTLLLEFIRLVWFRFGFLSAAALRCKPFLNVDFHCYYLFPKLTTRCVLHKITNPNDVQRYIGSPYHSYTQTHTLAYKYICIIINIKVILLLLFIFSFSFCCFFHFFCSVCCCVTFVLCMKRV